MITVIAALLLAMVGATDPARQIVLFSNRKQIYTGNLGNSTVTEQFCRSINTIVGCTATPMMVSYSYRELVDWPNVYHFNWAKTKVVTESGVLVSPSWKEFVQVAAGGSRPIPGMVLDDIYDTTLAYWTGTNQMGKTYFNRNCNDWTDATTGFAAPVGLAVTLLDGWYMDMGFALCDAPKGLMCACVLGTPRPTKRPTPPTKQPTTPDTRAPVP